MKLSLTILTAGLVALSASTSVLASPVSDSSDIVAERSTVLEERVQMAEPLEARRKHHKKRSGGKGKATWYAGAQMKNPACGGATPHDNSMVAAVSSHSQFKCGDHITLTRGSRKVTVKVVDKCAGCGTSPMHIDLSKGAFKKLASLSEGEVSLKWHM